MCDSNNPPVLTLVWSTVVLENSSLVHRLPSVFGSYAKKFLAWLPNETGRTGNEARRIVYLDNTVNCSWPHCRSHLGFGMQSYQCVSRFQCLGGSTASPLVATGGCIHHSSVVH